MNFNEEDIRSDVGFVCIGQAAGNIGLLFEEKGYNVLYINTSLEDLALLKNASLVCSMVLGIARMLAVVNCQNS